MKLAWKIAFIFFMVIICMALAFVIWSIYQIQGMVGCNYLNTQELLNKMSPQNEQDFLWKNPGTKSNPFKEKRKMQL